MSAPGELPRALQPWRTWLGWFELELALALGELVRRLADFVGDAASPSGRPTPEPDGLGDLRNRGSYERLIASEWLLADEIPEEFLRRAASSEHLFYAPSQRNAKADRRVIAVFDCGPRQLGAPRLAHLAAWILLARRAADLGGELNWGVLQEPGRLRGAQEERQLKELLDARRLEPGSASQFANWRAAIAALEKESPPGQDLEVWWIGTADDEPPGARDRRLSVRQTLQPGAIEAAFAVTSNLRRTELPLPADAIAAALLRGRVEREAAVVTVNRDNRLRLALTRPPLFSREGKHIGVPALAGHAMLVVAVPTSNQKRVVQRRRQEWSSLRQPVAATLKDRQAVALCADASILYFWQANGFENAAQRPDAGRFAPTSSARWMPMALIEAQRPECHRVCVIDRESRLIAWDAAGQAEPKMWQVDRGVLGLVPLSAQRIAFAVTYGGRLWLRDLHAASDTAGAQQRSLCVLEEALPPVWFSVGNRPHAPLIEALAVRRRSGNEEHWWLFTRARDNRAIDAEDGLVTHELQLQSGDRAIGVISTGPIDSASIVTLAANKRSLRLVGRHGTTLLHESEHPIKQASVCPDTGRIALLTGVRELIVLDKEGAMLMKLRDADEEVSP